MSVSHIKKGLVVGLIICGVMAFLIGRFTGIEPRWRTLRDGMTQAEVMHILGTPTWTGNGGCIGAGNKPVTRWEYHSRSVGIIVKYYVDFDYIGPGGVPVVFRTERFSEGLEPPSWWLWPSPRCRST